MEMDGLVCSSQEDTKPEKFQRAWQALRSRMPRHVLWWAIALVLGCFFFGVAGYYRNARCEKDFALWFVLLGLGDMIHVVFLGVLLFVVCKTSSGEAARTPMIICGSVLVLNFIAVTAVNVLGAVWLFQLEADACVAGLRTLARAHLYSFCIAIILQVARYFVLS